MRTINEIIDKTSKLQYSTQLHRIRPNYNSVDSSNLRRLQQINQISASKSSRWSLLKFCTLS